MFTADDHRYMTRALALARRGLYTTHPNPRVGCVLVKEGAIVGEGWHVRAGEPHAEVLALQQAGDRARGAAVYVTLEPCAHQGRTPPCNEALIKAGVSRVIAAIQDPNPRVAGKGLARLQEAGIETQTGLLAEEARALNAGFFQRLGTRRPWVRLKLAMSLDGRTALASGQSHWITGEAARRDVQYWRAQSSAVLTGIGTVLADNPRLNVRLAGDWRQPVRVVLDTRLRLSPDARLLGLPGETRIFTASGDAAAIARLTAAGALVEQAPAAGGMLELPAICERLAALEHNEVLVEAGATLAGALLEQGLVNELIIYMAPHLLGHRARALAELPGIALMEQRIEMRITDVRAFGEDWRIMAEPKARN